MVASNKKHEKSQIIILITALIVAFCAIVISSFLIARAIKSNSFSQSTVTTSEKLPAFNSDIKAKTEIKQDESDTVEGNALDEAPEIKQFAQTDKTAVEFIDYTSNMLLSEFKNVYSTPGYIDGGYTIYNYDVCPDMHFVVKTDGETKILDGKLSAITVTSGGKLMKNVFVGMTYKAIKSVVGDDIKPAEGTSEDCLYAKIDNSKNKYYTIIEFEQSGGKSVKATIYPK